MFVSPFFVAAAVHGRQMRLLYHVYGEKNEIEAENKKVKCRFGQKNKEKLKKI